MEDSEVMLINKLEELPLTLCRISKKFTGNNVIRVGYVMKPSREEDFAKKGVLPMYPTHNGLMFIPLTFQLPLEPQVYEVDVVFHKPTDEIINIELIDSSEYFNRISFSKGMQELKRYCEDHPDCCVIVPLDKIYPVVDRLMIQEILAGLEDLKTRGDSRIRAPYFLKVIAFRTDNFLDLAVPLLAVIQEYVDHSDVLYKFYVMGDKVFHVESSFEKDGLKPLCFNSL